MTLMFSVIYEIWGHLEIQSNIKMVTFRSYAQNDDNFNQTKIIIFLKFNKVFRNPKRI